MSNDLQADITTAMKGNGLTQATNGVSKLGDATKRANRDAKDYQQVAGAAFGSVTGQATRGNDAITKMGTALRMVGGEFGRLSSHVGHAAHMGAVFGSLAIGATAAGLAIHLLNDVMEDNVRRTEEAQKAQEEYANAVASGRSKIAGSAKAGEAQDSEIRGLAAVGGNAAVDRLNAVARNTTSPQSDVAKGMTKIYGHYGNNGTNAVFAIELAKQLDEVGIPFSASSDQIVKFGGLIGTAGGASKIGQFIFHQHFGAGAGSFSAALSSVRRNPYLVQSGQDKGVEAGIPVSQRNYVEQGYGNDAAHAALGETNSPVSQAVIELSKKRNEAVFKLNELIVAEGIWGNFLEKLHFRDGPARQLKRLEAANAAGSGH